VDLITKKQNKTKQNKLPSFIDRSFKMSKENRGSKSSVWLVETINVWFGLELIFLKT
jgi:hypothetical protein